MNNFERLMQCKVPEEFAYFFQRLKDNAIYANGRLLNSSPDNFIEWLKKETDEVDRNVIFNLQIDKCSNCGSLPTLQDYSDGTFLYVCHGCGRNRYDHDHPCRSELAARLQWNR